jgi:putative peptidoglycan binding protein/rare lipoprotein A (RlpA)-like double-psi beta-barrel protein
VRRRPPANNSLSSARPDRVAAWAFLLGVLLILLAATTSHGASGGAAAPGAAPGAQGEAPTGPATQLGQRLLSTGASGADVGTLQLILAARGYGPLAATGVFDAATEDAVRRFQRDAGLAIDGLVGPETRPKLLRLMRVRLATWYGPGLYGRRTSCGERLGPTTLGVAHRSLPCGTPVTFYRAGRFVTVRVIDRGPFRRGVAWDLTAAAAKAIGLQSTARLRSLH